MTAFNTILKQLRASVVALIVLTVITGVLYPIVVTLVGQTAFRYQANGSIILKDGKAVGSELIGQQFDDPRYFWGRLSETSPVAYSAYNADQGTGSTGSNLGPLNPALIGDGTQKDKSGNPIPAGIVKQRIDALRAADQAAGITNDSPIPVDLVTSSGSGLDPEISPAAAKYQVARIAKLRGLDPVAVQQLVDQYTLGRTLGILGEPRVRVLALNMALDALPNQKSAPTPQPTATASK